MYACLHARESAQKPCIHACPCACTCSCPKKKKKTTESSYLAQDLLLGGNSCYLYAFRRKLDRLNSRKVIFEKNKKAEERKFYEIEWRNESKEKGRSWERTRTESERGKRERRNVGEKYMRQIGNEGKG